ncbi:hypothetical protein AURDEDRAFT_119237 [Auricularia subglabra TFB-10046 SS5]|nr:hypothetical protein AURDEDRAFT_119237 [Auricularia subglabra TFB-10046 SS5]
MVTRTRSRPEAPTDDLDAVQIESGGVGVGHKRAADTEEVISPKKLKTETPPTAPDKASSLLNRKVASKHAYRSPDASPTRKGSDDRAGDIGSSVAAGPARRKSSRKPEKNKARKAAWKLFIDDEAEEAGMESEDDEYESEEKDDDDEPVLEPNERNNTPIMAVSCPPGDQSDPMQGIENIEVGGGSSQSCSAAVASPATGLCLGSSTIANDPADALPGGDNSVVYSEGDSLSDQRIPKATANEDAREGKPSPGAPRASAGDDEGEKGGDTAVIAQTLPLSAPNRHATATEGKSENIGNDLTQSANDPAASTQPSGSRTAVKTSTKQTRLPETFGPDDKKFDGSTNCLDHTLWDPELCAMYRKVRPPPRLISYVGQKMGAILDPAKFRKWTKHQNLPVMKEVLQMACTSQYVNISRMPFKNLRIETSGSAGFPFNYVTRKGTIEPALFVSLVEVTECSLLHTKPIPGKRDPSMKWEKKVLVANLFQQELELLICNLGCLYNVSQITLPSWSNVDESRGLTFHTRLGAVPLFDAQTKLFNLDETPEQLRDRPDMDDEAPPGALGVVFYTISDGGGPIKIEFNVHAFGLIATDPDGQWSDTWSESE